MKRLNIEGEYLWRSYPEVWKFNNSDLAVKDKTVNSLIKKELLQRITYGEGPNPGYTRIILSGLGIDYLVLVKKKEDKKLVKAIINRIPPELREPKIEYLTVEE